MYGAELYPRLEAETGVSLSWHGGGSLRLACTRERFEELQRQVAWARTFGLPLDLITPAEAQARFPLMAVDGVLGAAFLPTDGWLDPSGLAQAFAAGARRRGVAIRTGARVTAIGVERGRVSGVTYRQGGEERTLAADVVVDAGGMYAPEIARWPACTCRSCRWPTSTCSPGRSRASGGRADAARPRQPVLLPRGGRRAVHGRLRARPGAVGLDGIPADFNGRLLAPDWPRFEAIMNGAIRRVPAIESRPASAA